MWTLSLSYRPSLHFWAFRVWNNKFTGVAWWWLAHGKEPHWIENFADKIRSKLKEGWSVTQSADSKSTTTIPKKSCDAVQNTNKINMQWFATNCFKEVSFVAFIKFRNDVHLQKSMELMRSHIKYFVFAASRLFWNLCCKGKK